jgi:hypothetical protein
MLHIVQILIELKALANEDLPLVEILMVSFFCCVDSLIWVLKWC